MSNFYGRKDPEVLDVDQPLVRDLPFWAGGERQEGQVHEGLVNRAGELRPRGFRQALDALRHLLARLLVRDQAAHGQAQLVHDPSTGRSLQDCIQRLYMWPMTVSEVGRTAKGSSSSSPPAWVTMAHSGAKPSTCSASFWRKKLGIRSGK